MSSNDHPRIDGYRIQRAIGHGGMSTVWLAEQEALGRKVAIKVMLAEALADETSRSRFENETRTIARLQHPHIVGIHEIGRTADGLPFYTMPWLPRGHLGQRLPRGDQQKVADILRALLSALDYAHVRGIVHRDVKAENVLFDEADRPQLADFGIALRRGGGNPRLTSVGLTVGSTAYMPPEQARGQEVDRRADLYSLGVLTWESLTGSLPYRAGDSLSMALKHVQDPIPRLPAELKHWQDFIDSAMAKKPEDRYPSAQAMAEGLEQVIRRAGRNFGPVALPQSTPAPDATTASPRHWKRWVVVAAAAAVLIVGARQLGVFPGRDAGTASIAPAPAAPPAATDAIASPALPVPDTSGQDAVLGELDAALAADENFSGRAFIANAAEQLRAGRLLSPANANAWTSLNAAWKENPTHPRVIELTALVYDALAEAADNALRAGDADDSQVFFERAKELDARRGGEGSAIATLRKRLDTTLGTRFDALLARRDRAAAEALLADVGWLGLAPERRQALRARAAALPDATAAVAATAPASAVPVAAPVGPELLTVARADYARFVAATGRASAPCSSGRLFGSKRSWQSPGSVANRNAVVCVSAADAQDYATWLSAQESRRYRLPSAGEWRSQRSDASPTGWLTLCADTACGKRMVGGRPQALDANRGYPDVGLRLVREG